MKYLQSPHIVSIYYISKNLQIPVCFTENTYFMGQSKHVSTREDIELDFY